MGEHIHNSRRDAKNAKLALVVEFLQYNPDSTSGEVWKALGLAPRCAGIYLTELEALGRAQVTGQAKVASGQMANTWSAGGIAAYVEPAVDVDLEPVIKPVSAWAHGTATRYRMGQEVRA